MINKIDRSNALPAQVLEQGLRPLHRPRRRREPLDFPVLYTDARHGTATRTWPTRRRSTPVRGPSREGAAPATTRPSASGFDAASLDSERLRGAPHHQPRHERRHRANDRVAVVPGIQGGRVRQVTVVYVYEATGASRCPRPAPGRDRCGRRIEAMNIGETLADPRGRRAPADPHRQPTVAMLFSSNVSRSPGVRASTSPPATSGTGSYKEARTNVAVRIRRPTPGRLPGAGRGEPSWPS